MKENRLAKALCSFEMVKKDQFYELEIQRDNDMVFIFNTLSIPREWIKIISINDLDKYFDYLLSPEEILSTIKTNLKLTPLDIFECATSKDDLIWHIKYNHDLITVKIDKDISYYNNYKITPNFHVTIRSNDETHKHSYLISSEKNDVENFCNFIKFICGEKNLYDN